MSQELIEIIKKIGVEAEAFRNRYDKKIADLETAVARGQFPGGGSSRLDGLSASAREHAKAFVSWMRKGDPSGLRDLEVRAGLASDTDPSGGFFVPELIEATIDRVATAALAMRRICRVRKITTGEYKRLVSQGGTDSGWVGERAARPETDTPTLAEIAIYAKELYSNPSATQTLLDDASFPADEWLQEEISTEFDEQEGTAFISGNGVEKPKGIAAYEMVPNASYVWGKVGYIAGGHASLLNNVDKLFDLQHSLKPTYRANGTFLMNDLTLSVIRKLKDGEGRYIFVPGLQAGAPDSLLGKPVAVDDNVDDIGAGKYPIFFADFQKAYLIIDRLGIRLLRDPYSSKGKVFFYCVKRVGGGLISYEGIKALKISET
jgi:HK97 family phage major capsid protein